MPRKDYAFERGGSKHLEVSWIGGWKDFVVRLDGSEIGSITNKKELETGREFSLPDRSILKVQLTRKGLGLLRDGKPLPGSALDPAKRLGVVYGLILFIGGASLLVGLSGELLKIQLLQQLFGWSSVVTGVIYLVLGFFIKGRSVIALGIAVALWVILMAFDLFASLGMMPTWIIVRIFILLWMIKGFGAIRELKSQ